MSSNKVYGDFRNQFKLKELRNRWDYDDPEYVNGIPETFPIDQCNHSFFGASKSWNIGDIVVCRDAVYVGDV